MTQPTIVFSPLQAGVAAAGGALDVLEKRFGQHPWLNAKIEQLRDLADQDTEMVGKEVRLSMMRMSGRLVSKEEMAYEGGETHVSESIMPSLLRKKVSEGKGKKQDRGSGAVGAGHFKGPAHRPRSGLLHKKAIP